ncbi:hypothetical protein A2824_02770 [Candidatus Nomurabacteria bacterium RIFCSPHIGHO2_01_FULL_42_16]|uniref:DNA replication/recombination mediator RecO N-terminal domain-containing protein n=1 Tax=Candidatus Nomurabacteria bacterium RIFCSPHIGHO2_01_FULL_42_16 TaxID=1801743 RepID=A0A1F6VIV1_9BACT|nr:MAG: hypothetical protein A2824_02770 [Candidatus Nomurabacteria bacterium RIFCSPHIGHO2_01_FULL_42_16]
MHVIHKTEGFVLGSKNVREADKYFYIYTRDFGLIGAFAQGVRKSASKLRGHLQDFSLVSLELVQGREIWRITGAQVFPPLLASSLEESSARSLSWIEVRFLTEPVFQFLTNLSKLIRRLCPGEEKSEDLFGHLKEAHKFLSKGNPCSKEDIQAFECVAVLKILNTLGYVGDSQNLSFFVTSVVDKSVLEKAKEKRRILVAEINNSIKESQL